MPWTFNTTETDIKPRFTGLYGAYNDIDISADVPAASTGVVLHVRGSGAANKKCHFRPVGCTVDHSANSVINLSYHKYVFVKLDGSRKFNAYVEDQPSSIGIVAITDDTSANFSSNLEDVSIATPGYKAIDLHTLVPATSGMAMLELYTASTGVDYSVDLTYDENVWTKYVKVFSGYSGALGILPLPDTYIGRGQVSNANLDFFYLGGMASTWAKLAPPTSVDISLLAADGWRSVTLSSLPDGTTGIAFLLYNGEATTRLLGVRKYGGDAFTTNFKLRTLDKIYGICGVDSSKRIEVYSEANLTSKELIILGYYQGGVSDAMGSYEYSLWGSPMGSSAGAPPAVGLTIEIII